MISTLFSLFLAKIKSRYKNTFNYQLILQLATMTHHDGFAPVIDTSSMSYSKPSTIRPHTSDLYICTHCDISHDDSAHSGVTTHNVMVDDSNTYDGTFTSPTVLEDSSTYDSATHALVVPSASDQYVVTDPTSYDRVRNYYSIQSPDGYSITLTVWHMT